jgi:hypothetical protein
VPTKVVDKGEFYVSPSGKRLPSWYGDAVGPDGKKLAYGSEEMRRIRNKTFPGIAKAMASQWTAPYEQTIATSPVQCKLF